MTQREWRILQKGSRVWLVLDGKLIADMPSNDAQRLSAQIDRIAQKAKAYAQSSHLITDQALIARVSEHFGLHSNIRVVGDVEAMLSTLGG